MKNLAKSYSLYSAAI